MYHDLEIEKQRYIFNINQVEFAALDHLFDVFCISKLDHPPTAEPRLYFRPFSDFSRASTTNCTLFLSISLSSSGKVPSNGKGEESVPGPAGLANPI